VSQGTHTTTPIVKAHPAGMTIRHPGEEIRRSPEGTASTPFWVEMLFDSTVEGENTAMRTMLDPGVISHWHTHPRGQLLYVLSGLGLVQREGGLVEEVRAGDCIWFAPDEKHWHGAAANSPFSYLSVQGVHDGRYVTWMEPVSRT
jgi:quercetin dioxygenase-like cupin family protein